MKRYDKVLLLALLFAFAAGIFITARSAMSTYVSFAQAREAGHAVQVKGRALAGTLQEAETGKYAFQMQDDSGEIVRVVAYGELPANLFEAESVVVKGKYSDGAFEAQAILVKCPSKYEAEEHPEGIKKE